MAARGTGPVFSAWNCKWHLNDFCGRSSLSVLSTKSQTNLLIILQGFGRGKTKSFKAKITWFASRAKGQWSAERQLSWENRSGRTELSNTWLCLYYRHKDQHDYHLKESVESWGCLDFVLFVWFFNVLSGKKISKMPNVRACSGLSLCLTFILHFTFANLPCCLPSVLIVQLDVMFYRSL